MTHIFNYSSVARGGDKLTLTDVNLLLKFYDLHLEARLGIVNATDKGSDGGNSSTSSDAALAANKDLERS